MSADRARQVAALTITIGRFTALLSWCEEMTRWTPEERAEGIAMVANGEDETDLEFPRLRAAQLATTLEALTPGLLAVWPSLWRP